MIDYSHLGIAIREARNQKKYTQEYLAELLNITPTHMKHIESGHRKPSIDVYFRMVEVLGFSTDNFLQKEATPKTKGLRGELALMLARCSLAQLKVVHATVQALLEEEDEK